MFDRLFIEFSTNWVAVYAAVIASFGLFLSLLNYFRDSASLKIEFKPDWTVLGQHEQYKENTIYSEIRVTNRGRRPIRIEKLGARVKNEKKWIMIFDPYWFNKTNRILTEENPSSSIYWEKKLFPNKNIYYFSIQDAAGRSYKKWLHPLRFVLDGLKFYG